MDGSAFKVTAEGETAETAGPPLPLCAEAAIAPASPPGLMERLVHPLALGLAAIAHLALAAAMLPVESDVLGDGGTALESVAVAIVERVPVMLPPSAGVRHAPVEPVPEEPRQEVAEAAPAQRQPVEPPKPPEVKMEIPPDDAPTEAPVIVAAKPPEPERKPGEQREQPPDLPPAEPQQQQTAAAPAEMAVARVAVEASSGVVKAYESQLSKVIASRPPQPRGLKGRLVVELVIGTDGKPESTSVIEPSGRQALDAMVVAALQRLKFPAPPPQMTLKQRTFHQAFVYN